MDEYSIVPSAFRRTLLDQRKTRMKGGLYHLTQVLMAYNTNRIEGSQLDAEQTRYIYETRTIAGDDVSVDDVIETSNSFQLFDEMLDNLGSPITAETLKAYHRTLKHGTADARRAGFAVGEWKRQANVVGGKRTTAPQHVELAVGDLLGHMPTTMDFNDVVDFHHAFERIHPFQDGNGRVGRIVMFQQCLANGLMPFVVLDSQKSFYFRGLDRYDEEPGFLRDTLRSMQDAYHARFGEFVELLAQPTQLANAELPEPGRPTPP